MPTSTHGYAVSGEAYGRPGSALAKRHREGGASSLTHSVDFEEETVLCARVKFESILDDEEIRTPAPTCTVCVARLVRVQIANANRVGGVRLMKIDRKWHDTKNGGIIQKTGRNDYLASPKAAGMNSIRHFSTEREARAYAEGLTPRRIWNSAMGDSSHSTYHFGLSHGGDRTVRTTLRVGDLAFLDTLGAGLIPVRIDRVIRPGHGSVVGDGRVVVIVTAARPGYRLGESVEAGVDKVVPRTHVRRSGYHLKVDTRYDIR